MSADRDRETRLAEAREEIIDALRVNDYPPFWQRGREGIADLLLPVVLRAVGEGDRLRRDLAALAERLRGTAEVCGGKVNGFVFADELDALLDGGEGGR